MSNMSETAGGAPKASFLSRYALWLIPAIIVAIMPPVLDSSVAMAVLNQMGIAVIFTVAYNMMLGQGGMLSFGFAVYFGLGGYFAIHGVNIISEGDWPVPLPFVPFLGGLAGLAFGALFGSFSTNRAGTVFAMISLGLGEMMASSSLIFSKFSGGEEGITTDRTEIMPFFGVEFTTEREIYYLIAGWVFFAVFLMYRFSRTPIGRIANAVRDNPERAEFLGYSQKWVRFMSFSISGCFAGVAGALFALNYEIVTEETVGALTSGVVLLQAYIGGIGFFAGPIVGAVIFTLLQTLMSNYTEIWALYVGLVFVGTVMYAPAGLTGLFMMHVPVYRVGRMGRLTAPYSRIAVPALICALGAIGFLELWHHISAAATGESEAHIFFMTLDFTSPIPWIVFVAMFFGGLWDARRVAPVVADTYGNALHYAFTGEDQ
jgi:branched-chain amino acid transport system permease protein